MNTGTIATIHTTIATIHTTIATIHATIPTIHATSSCYVTRKHHTLPTIITLNLTLTVQLNHLKSLNSPQSNK